MKRTIILPGLVTVFVALSPAAAALADAHTGGDNTGTGQPNQSANFTPGSVPPGFLSGGFAHAETVYANPAETGSSGGVHSGNSHVVSQYDVAGTQFCTHSGTPC